ncbi:MAG: phosphate acyltransferase [Spirochaetota bacterium]
MNFRRFFDEAKRDPRRIVFAEPMDERTLSAIAIIQRERLAVPILIGEPDDIRRRAESLGADIGDVAIVPVSDARRERFAHEYCKRRDVSDSVAERLIAKPLYFGGMMVSLGDADGMLSGAISTTASVIKAAAMTVGMREGFTHPFAYMALLIPDLLGETDKLFFFADAAVTISPNTEELAAIGVAVAQAVRTEFNIEPMVAFLSYSTRGSGQGASVDIVRDAVERAKNMAPDVAIDGELQLDAAIIPEVAERKAKDSPVAGRANVLVFPDLDAGNIGYKIAQYMSGGHAYGPVLIGLKKPVNDMSRGVSVEDIVGTAVITVLQAQHV